MPPIFAHEAGQSQCGKCGEVRHNISGRSGEGAGTDHAEEQPHAEKGGYAYFIIKSQSVDVSKDPREVYGDELAKLERHLRGA